MKKFTCTIFIIVWVSVGVFYSQNNNTGNVNSNNIHANANAAANSAEANPSATQNETVMRYLEFLREETKQHREYTQSFYTYLLYVIGGIGTLLGAVFTWLNWQSKKEIENQVSKRVDKYCQPRLDEKFTEVEGNITDRINENFKKVEESTENSVNRIIAENREKIFKHFDEMNRKNVEQLDKTHQILLELSAKSEQIGKKANLTNRPDSPAGPGRAGYTSDINKVEITTDLSKLKEKKVLWITDSTERNDSIRKIFETPGVQFDLAANGEEAVAKLLGLDINLQSQDSKPQLPAGIERQNVTAQKNFDLIVYDTEEQGNEKNGTAFLQDLDKLDLKPKPPVVIYTSRVNEYDAVKNDVFAVVSELTQALNVIQKALLTTENLVEDKSPQLFPRM